MMNLQSLARKRAECAARLESLANVGAGGDPEENRELAIARSRAETAYEAAEAEFQRATATLTTQELRELGVAA